MIGRELKEVAKHCAADAGISLNEWLLRAIRAQIALQVPVRPITSDGA